MMKKLGMLFTLAFVVGLAFVFNGGQASAATEHTVTANLYVKASDNQVKLMNAYLTNSAYTPSWAVSDNAKLTAEDDGTFTLSVPVVNNTFALISLGQPDGGVWDITKTRNEGTYGTHTDGRITNLTMKIQPGATSIYFTGNLQYANHIFAKGDKNFHLTLDVDWSNVSY